ncbi:MAG: hypothetical protein MI741_10315 [Rhodospirillales bacterium]|nr:hypothetical protein [Rhodospirillales bacterium]
MNASISPTTPQISPAVFIEVEDEVYVTNSISLRAKCQKMMASTPHIAPGTAPPQRLNGQNSIEQPLTNMETDEQMPRIMEAIALPDVGKVSA